MLLSSRLPPYPETSDGGCQGEVGGGGVKGGDKYSMVQGVAGSDRLDALGYLEHHALALLALGL